MKKLIAIIMLFFSPFYLPQTLTSGLVIQEVYLNQDNPDLNWIKLFNPQQENEDLGYLRISHIRTPNVMPVKSFKLKPGSKVILCADIKSFKKIWKDDIELIEVKTLNSLTEGGFIAVGKSTFANPEKVDVLRYGDFTKTEKVEEINKFGVVPFSKDNKIYKRKSIDKIKYSKYAGWE